LSKCYQIYAHPRDRLMQALFHGHRNFYREFWALRDINLELPRGQTLGVIGRNGSGKSTLLQIICGTLAPTSGSVKATGRIAALLELGAGFHPDFTGRENVFLNARILGLTREQTEARFDQIAAFAEIGEFIDQPVKTYSSGMFVRLAFSVIAHVDADILVIDEALAVGDAFFTQKCMRFLRQFRETGTIIFASHDAAAVLSLCDRALWLEAGRIRGLGPAKAVNEAYLAELFADISRQRAAPADPADRPKSAPINAANSLSPFTGPPVHAVPASSAAFGEGGARILGVDIMDAVGNALQVAQPGASVTVRIHFRALRPLAQPIAGFYLKDRLGPNLFGQNTALTYAQSPPPMVAGEERIALFAFDMPVLQAGQYMLAVAIAEGTLDQHVQHHWIHEAYLLTAAGREAIATGLVGIPMDSAEFRQIPEQG
jgi:lipopolysaccharide transport system ATP-binding protein